MQNAHLLTRMPVSILLPTGAVLLNGRTLLRGGAEQTQAENQPKSERKFSRKSAKVQRKVGRKRGKPVSM